MEIKIIKINIINNVSQKYDCCITYMKNIKKMC